MSLNQVSFTPNFGLDSNLFGRTGVDISLYTQLLLVKDYDDQLKDAAHSIRISTKLKESYRTYKQKVQELYAKPKDKDGKIELTRQELDLLESKPNYSWDKGGHDGQGKVETRYEKSPIDAIHSGYKNVDYELNSSPTVAAYENARVWGDPHIDDPDLPGGHWDFQGVPGEIYTYLNDTNIEINAKHKAWNGNTTVIDELQFILQTSKEGVDIRAHGNGAVTLNGKDVAPGNTFDLGSETTLERVGNVLYVSTPEYTFKAEMNGSHIDLEAHTRGMGVGADGKLPDGVLGKVFDANQVSSAESETTTRQKYQKKDFTEIDNSTVKVEKDKIEAEMERIQMEIENLNGNGELMSLTIQSLTQQRKTAFETVSNIFSKSAEAANNIARNIGR